MNRRRRALLLTNPAAHSVTRRGRDEAAAILKPSFDLEQVDTKAPGHATELAIAAADGDADLVIVLGGDGTLGEVAQGLAGTAVALGVLPGGEANVLARAVGIPNRVRDAARLVADRAGPGHEDAPGRRIPLGRMDGRWFLASCGVGFDAAIVRDVERHPRTKKRAGDWFFLWTGIRLFYGGYDRRNPGIELTWGPGPDERAERLFLVVVQNLPPYTFFGPRAMRLCPDASLEGRLDAFAMDSFRSAHVLPVLFSSFGRARHARWPHVVSVHDRSHLSVRCAGPMPVQADGEYLGERPAVEVELVPAALSVIC